MTKVDEDRARYQRYLDLYNIKTVGGAEIVLCPLCPEIHAICQFDSGYLGCVIKECRNPHHRSGPYKVPYKWTSMRGDVGVQ
jgi:hypothetical protein